jgi:hypothetical protein
MGGSRGDGHRLGGGLLRPAARLGPGAQEASTFRGARLQYGHAARTRARAGTADGPAPGSVDRSRLPRVPGRRGRGRQDSAGRRACGRGARRRPGPERRLRLDHDAGRPRTSSRGGPGAVRGRGGRQRDRPAAAVPPTARSVDPGADAADPRGRALGRRATLDMLRFLGRVSGVLVPFLAQSLDRATLPAFHAMNEALKRRAEQAAASRLGRSSRSNSS